MGCTNDNLSWCVISTSNDSKSTALFNSEAQRDISQLLSRFILFYNSADKLESFLKQFPVFPNAFLVGGAADIFVNELTDQKLKVEPVLLHYLSQILAILNVVVLQYGIENDDENESLSVQFHFSGGPLPVGTL